MNFDHRSGILLHVTSLPSPYGIGDLGPDTYKYLDFLVAARVRWWQVLPLGPTGYGDSPYQSFSSFAGNPLLVSPALLQADGLIDEEHLIQRPAFPANRVDFAMVSDWKRGLFQVAFMRLAEFPELNREFDQFREQNAHWLDDYSLFMTLKAQEGLVSWIHWRSEWRDREPVALAAAREQYAATIAFYAFQQFLFFRQWQALRERMAQLNIGLIGDLPIYVAEDSSDVWCNRELFEMDASGRALRVAGVPPDMFSETGQLWGNPLYRWEAHKAQGYKWWLARLNAVLGLVDVLRLDHFRGFADYYAIAATEPTAMHGIWELGPGADFFNAVNKEFGGLPLIAEDLGGESSPLVVKLRDDFNLSGMKVFQFAFDDGMEHQFLPHNYPEACVAYTGTHDNDTTLGWVEHAPESEREFCLRYLKSDGEHIPWDMIRSLWASRAEQVLAPIQDFLELGTEARMNYPGRPLGNWNWRVQEDQLSWELAERIASLNLEFKRAA
jgi:4-alpha-glucanotransferase